MKRFSKIIFNIGLTAALVLSFTTAISCSNTATTDKTSGAFSITDDQGNIINFSSTVDSIVSLAPSNTEIVYFVEAGGKLIGRTDYCNYPEKVSSVESIGGYSTPDKEKIVVLDPDVVLATGIHVSSGDVDWLEEQGLTVVVIDPEDINDILDDILLVGKLTGNEDFAKEQVAGLEDRINHITGLTSKLNQNQRVSMLHVTWHDPLWTAGPDTFIGAVMDMAGGTNIFSDVSGDVQVDTELAVTRNPEAITVVSSHGDYGQESYNYIVAQDSPFSTTAACINHKVMMIDGDLASRPGPRIVDALEQIAKFIHPELFP
jgi:iron complex transport system substrate-binding protein